MTPDCFTLYTVWFPQDLRWLWKTQTVTQLTVSTKKKKNKPVAQEKHSYSWYKVWKKLLPWVLTKRSKPHPLSYPPECATVGILGLFAGILQCGLMAQDQASDLWSNSPRGQTKTGQVYHSLMVFLHPKDIWRLWGRLLQKETFILDLMKSLSSTNISSKYSTIATKKTQAFGTQSMLGDESSNPMTSVRCFRRHHSAAWMDLKCLSLSDIA